MEMSDVHEKGQSNAAFTADDRDVESKQQDDADLAVEIVIQSDPNGIFSSEHKQPGDEEEGGGGRGDMKLASKQTVVGSLQLALRRKLHQHQTHIWDAIKVCLLLLYFAYFGYALYYRFGDEGSLRLLVCTVFGVMLLLLYLTSDVIRPKMAACCTCFQGQTSGSRRCATIFRWTLYVVVLGFIVIYTGLDMGRKDPRNLQSLAGLALFITLLYLTSASPAHVNWHPVFWGLSMQYIFALLIIRTSWGFQAFDWLGDRVTEMLAYSNKGASFVFGDKYTDHIFAMKALPVIVYFSSLISVLYYLGVMQAIIGVVGRFLAFCLNTSPTESLSAAGNIFVGQTEAPLMIRPFMEKMTRSELHAIMTGGFATVSGSVLGSYITFGVKASYLLGASVMAAPCSLALSKLTFPETERNVIDAKEVYKIASGSANNVIEAASSGASTAIKLVANVAVNVMAFLAILEFLNATLVWLGDRAGVDGLSFEFLCSYLFYPITFVMGVDEEDCRRVAQLIGYKVFSNEFVAYIELGHLLDNRDTLHNYTALFGANTTLVHDGLDIVLPRWNNTVLPGGVLSSRSEVIATYALCGFANLGSMGIQLGGLSAMAPARRSDLSRLVLRAMMTGCVVCFTTACIAGLFFDEK